MWMFFKALGWANFTYLDAPWKWFNELVGYSYSEQRDSPLNHYEDAGYNPRFYRNFSSFFFSFIMYALLWIIVGIGLTIMKKKTKFKRFMLKVKMYMTVSALLRCIILTYF